MIAHMLCGHDVIFAVDSTGFSCFNDSRHFVTRFREMEQRIRYRNDARKGFSKAPFVVGINTKMILACDCMDPIHVDVNGITRLMDDLADGGFNIETVVADKRYDVEYVHVEI